jgi:hypothetical protein
MIKIMDEASGQTAVILRVIQSGPDLDVLGLGIYAGDHDFTKSRKPLQILYFHETLDFIVRNITSDAMKTEGRSPGREEFLKKYRNVKDQVKAHFKGEAQDPPDDLDWDAIRFPEEIIEEESAEDLAQEAMVRVAAIFRKPSVRM